MKAVKPEDIERAKIAIRNSEEISSKLLMYLPIDNDPSKIEITKDQKKKIRKAMREYEKNEADIFEDKKYYISCFNLQFLDCCSEGKKLR